MNETIFEIFKDLLNQLPQDFEPLKAFEFNQDVLPGFEQSEFDTFMITIQKGRCEVEKEYNFFELHVCTNKQYYELQALIILTAVFKNSSITLNLTNPESFIKKIIVEYDYNTYRIWKGFLEKPVSFLYQASEIRGSGNSCYDVDPFFHVPEEFILQLQTENIITQEEWHKRNVLRITGSSAKMICLSSLLLNIGNKKNNVNKIDFDCSEGSQGFLPIRIEVKFWLPDSIGWKEKALIANDI